MTYWNKLRQQAEEIARKNRSPLSQDLNSISLEEARQLLHELQVKQIELEMQNEELIRVQNELETARARYFDLFDLAPVGYITLTIEGNILEANLPAATLLGLDRDSLIKKPLTRFVASEDQDLFYLFSKRLFTNVEDQSCEVRMVRQDRTCFWAGMEATSVCDESRNPVFRLVLKDITERKQFEEARQEFEANKREQEAVRDSAERFRSILKTAMDGFCVATPDGRLLDVNEAYCRMSGYSASELLKMNISDLEVNETPNQTISHIRQIISQGQTRFETRHRRKDGSVFDVAVSVQYQPFDGGRCVTFLRDITERKRTEMELRENNRRLEILMVQAREMAIQAQAATVAKSRFLSNMSHEIRTPLNAILGFSQLMKSDPELSPKERDWVKTINRNGEHLLALLNNILELSKIEAGREPLVLTTFDLRAMLGDLAVTFRHRAEAKGLTFAAEVLDGVPTFIVSDELKLRQVLINLLGNAVKFTSSGEIRVRVWVESSIPEMLEKLQLIVLVEDSGPGIKVEDRERIFEAFEQTSIGRQVGSQGTGLGLAICHRFARMMGGDIRVMGETVTGAALRFEIPVLKGTAPKVLHAIDELQMFRLADGSPPCRILIVDDIEDNRHLLVQALSEAGFEVFACGGGAQALELFADATPQLILMDKRISGEDGDEVIRRIRSSPGGEGVKIITITANATEEARSETLLAGADDFLAKPFRLGILLEKIRSFTGVRYMSAEPGESSMTKASPQTATGEILQDLPAELRKQMCDAAIRGRHAFLLTLIGQVAGLDPALAAKLRDSAARFDYEKILEVLE